MASLSTPPNTVALPVVRASVDLSSEYPAVGAEALAWTPCLRQVNNKLSSAHEVIFPALRNEFHSVFPMKSKTGSNRRSLVGAKQHFGSKFKHGLNLLSLHSYY